MFDVDEIYLATSIFPNKSNKTISCLLKLSETTSSIHCFKHQMKQIFPQQMQLVQLKQKTLFPFMSHCNKRNLITFAEDYFTMDRTQLGSYYSFLTIFPVSSP